MKTIWLSLLSIFLMSPIMGQGIKSVKLLPSPPPLLPEPLPGMEKSQESMLSDTLYSLYINETSLALPAMKLPKFQPNPCLFTCLTKLVKTDKGCSGRVGYYFSSVDLKGKELIKVAPVLLSRVPKSNFCGYFIYGDRYFLCVGKNDVYLSSTATPDSITLKPFVSEMPTADDFYLGGDTDGVLDRILCDNQLVHTLIKPATRQHRRKRNYK